MRCDLIAWGGRILFTATSLKQLLSSLRSNEATQDNRRRSPRVGLRIRTDIWHPTRGRMSAWVRDLSAGGANILVPVSMLVGDTLQLLLETPTDTYGNNGGQLDKIACEVRHCRELAPNMFSVGLKFVEATDQ